MKVLIVATEDFLGAGKASFRIYEALMRGGNQVSFLVKNKVYNSDDRNVIEFNENNKRINVFKYIFSKILHPFEKSFATDPNYYFFGQFDKQINRNISKIVKELPFIPEFIIITWVSRFLNSRLIAELALKTGAKIIYYPMDMSTFTGGCHYSWECNGYVNSCDVCPAIINTSNKRFAKENLQEKILYNKKITQIVVAASEQLFQQISISKLFKNIKVKKHLLPIDETRFNNSSRKFAKKKFDIVEGSIVLFFGASFSNEKRKGIEIFLKVLELINIQLKDEKRKNLIVMIAGYNSNSENLLKSIPFSVKLAGYIDDDNKLAMAYQASDLFICTSIQDSGPMMVNEALMCGTPVVMHDLGIASDLIENGISGYKIKVGDQNGFAKAVINIIDSVYDNQINNNLISQKARLKTSYSTFYNDFRQTLKLFEYG